MKKIAKRMMSALLAVLLLASVVLVPSEVDAASEFHGDYTDVCKIYDIGSCPAMQGMAVGSQMLYTVKINSSDTLAAITMTDKDDSSSTVTLYNADAGSYYFNYLNHANDMDVWGIDGYSNLFVTTTVEGSNSIVRLKRSGNSLTKVAGYSLSYNGSPTWASAVAVKDVTDGMINFIFKLGMDIYTGSVSTSATSADIALTKLCTISKSKVYIKGEYLDLSTFVNQGMGYWDNMLYVPISGDDDWLERSVIMVFNLDDVIQGSTIYPSEAVVFRVTSGTYSALFEIESCGICPTDGRLYFNTNRRKTDSDTNHDGLSYFDTYSYVKLTEPAHYHSYTVQYEANGGTGTMDNTVVPYGVSTALRTNSYTRIGYEFAGWTAYRTTYGQWYYTDGSSTGWYTEGSQPSGYYKYIYRDGVNVAKTSGVDGDVVKMYAQWEAASFNVTFQDEDGTVLQSGQVAAGAVPTAPAAPTKASDGVYTYTFAGWDKELTACTADTVYTATYTPNKINYTVEFRDWDGTVISSAAYNYGDTVTVPANPTRASDGAYSYTFAGWDKTVTTCTGSAVYTATYTTTTLATITPKYPSLSFESEIYYNVYFEATGTDGVALTDMGLLTWNTPQTAGTIETATEIIPGAVLNSNGYYSVRSNGIPAKKLADTLYFKVYMKLADGSYVYSNLYNYSAKTYAKDRLANSTNTKMKALCVAMLNYGAAAQTHFGYRPYDLMNADLTAEQQALVSAYNSGMVAGVSGVSSSKVGAFVYNSAGYSSRYPSVSFEGAFSINYYFTPALSVDNGVTLYYWNQAAYDSASVLTTSNATGKIAMTYNGTNYEAAVSGIAAKDIDSTIFVAGVYTSGGVSYVTGVLPYSLGAYCVDRINNSTVATMQDFAAETAVYGYYAKQYFA